MNLSGKLKKARSEEEKLCIKDTQSEQEDRDMRKTVFTVTLAL